MVSVCTVENGDTEIGTLKSGDLMDSAEIPSWLANTKNMKVIEKGDQVG